MEHEYHGAVDVYMIYPFLLSFSNLISALYGTAVEIVSKNTGMTARGATGRDSAARWSHPANGYTAQYPSVTHRDIYHREVHC